MSDDDVSVSDSGVPGEHCPSAPAKGGLLVLVADRSCTQSVRWVEATS